MSTGAQWAGKAATGGVNEPQRSEVLPSPPYSGLVKNFFWP